MFCFFEALEMAVIILLATLTPAEIGKFHADLTPALQFQLQLQYSAASVLLNNANNNKGRMIIEILVFRVKFHTPLNSAMHHN